MPTQEIESVNRVLLSVPELARQLGVSERFVWGEIAGGRLKAKKLGRLTKIPADALNDYLAELPATSE